MDTREEKLKRAAELYARKEGESFLAEADEINRQNVSYMTPRDDKTVRDLITGEKRPKQRRALFGLCAAAACIVFTIALINVIPGGPGSGANIAQDSMESEAAPMPPPETAPATILPAEIMPISFALPADFRVEGAELDNGMSVYSLGSDNYGDVVLTMYYLEEGNRTPETAAYAGFDEITIDGTVVPAKVHDTYKLLAFDFDGVSYTLSSEDDLGSLAAFYRNIEKYSRYL